MQSRGARADLMVARQLKARGLDDPRVLDAMRRVPREQFVPRALQDRAYDDSPLPIGEEQTISQPYIVARMIEALELETGDRVLEIGTGSGYAAAVLAEVAATVYTIERLRGLADAAKERLEAQGYDSVEVICGDGSLGLPEHAPFDAIVVTAGGPSVPRALREQLAVGGRLVIPVGARERLQQLVRIRRLGEDRYDREDLGAVRFVPLVGEQAWRDPGAKRRRLGAPGRAKREDALRQGALPFASIGDDELEGLLARIGDARVILLGEATHGTREFYELRARITRGLIERADVGIVALEADWPDARQIDRFVRGREALPHPERAFARFPQWMWANRQMLDFVRELKDINAARDREPVGIYGLDLYSMHASIGAVLAYLGGVDAAMADEARRRYECLEPWREDPAGYGAAALSGPFDDCAADVTRMLEDLLGKRLAYEANDGERFFDAARNAAIVRNAERYYRAMYLGRNESWNLRDTHMFETLEALLARRPSVRAVVWAHNSHLGDARATSMGRRGELNLGQLCREQLADACYAIGFGTDHGTVAAADAWDGPVRIQSVRPAQAGSYEALCHETGIARFLLPLESGHNAEARALLGPERLERAIGVIYRPETELASHYFRASLPRQFDEWIWIDETEAVEPITVPVRDEGIADTFPFGL